MNSQFTSQNRMIQDFVKCKKSLSSADFTISKKARYNTQEQFCNKSGIFQILHLQSQCFRSQIPKIGSKHRQIRQKCGLKCQSKFFVSDTPLALFASIYFSSTLLNSCWLCYLLKSLKNTIKVSLVRNASNFSINQQQADAVYLLDH